MFLPWYRTPLKCHRWLLENLRFGSAYLPLFHSNELMRILTWLLNAISLLTPRQKIIFRERNHNAIDIFDTHHVPIYTGLFLLNDFLPILNYKNLSVKTNKGIKLAEGPFLQLSPSREPCKLGLGHACRFHRPATAKPSSVHCHVLWLLKHTFRGSHKYFGWSYLQLVLTLTVYLFPHSEWTEKNIFKVTLLTFSSIKKTKGKLLKFYVIQQQSEKPQMTPHKNH